MAHPTRGHRSGTYEIQELVAVDPDDLSITYRTAAAYQPQTRRLEWRRPWPWPSREIRTSG